MTEPRTEPLRRQTLLLRSLYGKERGSLAAVELARLIKRHRHAAKMSPRLSSGGVTHSPAAGETGARGMRRPAPRSTSSHSGRDAALCERDALLVTYADQVREPGVAPLKTLARFCECHLGEVVSGIHLLPFYPWSSDDGFSVKDYFAVAPQYGSWEDIGRFRPRFDLMFDAVFNHLSAQGDWFQRFLRNEPGFRNFFVTVEGNPDLSQVVRPRALPLLTEFSLARRSQITTPAPPCNREKDGGEKARLEPETGTVPFLDSASRGERKESVLPGRSIPPDETGTLPRRVWTTFSADQVDLNFKNPRVLMAVLEALLFYVDNGARFIRLDAIAYLWKEIGTPCIHLPQTHAVIQLMRAVLDEAAPEVQLITETNVPHADNVSYFGDGVNEAQLVYNFALPPLVLHALLRGDATHLTRWAAGLRTPSGRTTFFNFLASHDGIGLNPARGILPDGEIDFLVGRCQAHGGFISYKQNPDGSKSPYEMNIVYFDAINDPAAGEAIEAQVDRFMAAQAIMLSLAGVPGIYFHSLFGSRNDRQAALDSGIHRRINRQKLDRAALERELADPASLRARVFSRFRKLLHVHRDCAAFHPRAAQAVLELDPRVFAVERASADGAARVLCLHNLSRAAVTLDAPDRQIGLQPHEVIWICGDTRLV
jgi:sucrose phosphorylase